jgi:hypothetical protein
VKISQQALIKRINRKLRQDDEVLRITRGERWKSGLGDFYIHNWRNNFVTAHYVDPVELGRELGVHEWEQVEGEQTEDAAEAAV